MPGQDGLARVAVLAMIVHLRRFLGFTVWMAFSERAWSSVSKVEHMSERAGRRYLGGSISFCIGLFCLHFWEVLARPLACDYVDVYEINGKSNQTRYDISVDGNATVNAAKMGGKSNDPPSHRSNRRRALRG